MKRGSERKLSVNLLFNQVDRNLQASDQFYLEEFQSCLVTAAMQSDRGNELLSD